MVLDIFKILIDEPGKLKRAGLTLCKFALNIILANYLYVKFFGSYHLIQLTNYKEWLDCALSGRLWAGVLLFGLSDFILFNLLPVVTTLPLVWISERMGRRTSPLILYDPALLKTLDFFQLITYNKISKSIKVGKWTNDLYEFISSKTLKETENTTMKKAFVSDLWHTYMVSYIAFLGIMELEHSYLFNWILLIGLLVLGCVYITISVSLSFLYDYEKDLKYMIDRMREEALIEETFNRIDGTTIMGVEHPEYDTILYYKDEQYIFRFFKTGGTRIHEYFVEEFLKLHKRTELKIFIFSNMPPTKEAANIINKSEGALNLFVYKDEETIKSHIPIIFNHER